MYRIIDWFDLKMKLPTLKQIKAWLVRIAIPKFGTLQIFRIRHIYKYENNN